MEGILDLKKSRIFICILLCISLLPLSVFAIESEPIQISTEAQLRSIANNLSGSYILTQNIELTSPWSTIGNSSNAFSGTLDGNGYTISNITLNTTKDFKGLFGYVVDATIKNLTLSGDITVYASTGTPYNYIGGFCGGAKNSTFLNCTNNVNVNGNKNVGGICGRAFGCTFTNCENNGTIIADESAGGICGRAVACNISIVRNYAAVSALTSAGGICGVINQATSYTAQTVLSKSFNVGSITVSTSRAGGIVGFAQASTGSVRINDCFNSGNISSDSASAYLGGISGDISQGSTNNVIFSCCYNVGKISTNSYSGGISGGEHLQYANCYYLDNSSLPICVGKDNTSLSKDNMLLEQTYSGFDFSSVWTLSTTGDFKYPQLVDNPIKFELSIVALEVSTFPYTSVYYKADSLSLETTNLSLTAYYNDGTVEENITTGFTVSTPEFYLGLNPVIVTYKGATTFFPIYVYRDLFEKESLRLGNEYYIPVYSQKNLENIVFYPEGKYFLLNNIVCDSSFAGIGSDSVSFEGIFLGNNNSITLNISSTENAGLFKSISSATIKDLTIDGSVSGVGFVGGIAAIASNPQISSITNKATVTATASGNIACVGGIIGYADFSSGSPSITKCENEGTLALSSSAKKASIGGIIGQANVTTNNNVTLSELSNSAQIALSSSTSSSTDYAGGIVGNISSPSGSGSVTIEKAYSASKIMVNSSSYVYLGGLVGDFEITSATMGSLTIKNSFNIGTLDSVGSPYSITLGGIISTANYATVKLSNCYNAASINASNTSKGGAIVSNVDFNGTLENCYYIEGNVSDSNATKLTINEALAQQSYAGFDFGATWVLNNSFIYPQLSSDLLTLTVQNIEITTPPQKLEYIQNIEEFSSDGGELSIVFDNGSTYTVPLSSAQISGFDNGSLGTKTLTVTFMDKTDTFTVEIVEKPRLLTHIEVITPPTKTTYIEGEQLDTTGLIVKAFYDNETSEEITDYTLTGFTSTIGEKEITVSYGGLVTLFSVSVIPQPVTVPERITSSTLIISDETVSKINANTTVSTLLSNINEAQYCAIFNGETQLNDDDIVGTGMVIKLFDGTDEKASYTLVVTGDLDGNGFITDRDAIYLLYNTFLPQQYPLTQNCDFDKDGYVTDKDAIYLLYHTFLPETYPI